MGYKVERDIKDVEFDEVQIEEIRERIRKELVEEKSSVELDEALVEERLQEELFEIAVQRTLQQQGDNRLHLDVRHGSVREDSE